MTGMPRNSLTISRSPDWNRENYLTITAARVDQVDKKSPAVAPGESQGKMKGSVTAAATN
jgi:hypothetical protein